MIIILAKIEKIAHKMLLDICLYLWVMNSIGKLFRLTTFGESHGAAIGGIIDGCPSGLSLDLERIQSELDRRKPGQSSITTLEKKVILFSFTLEFLKVKQQEHL